MRILILATGRLQSSLFRLFLAGEVLPNEFFRDEFCHEDRCGEADADQDRSPRSDCREEQSVFEDGVAVAEKDGEQKQIFITEIALLRAGSDDPRSIGEAEDQTDEQRKGGFSRHAEKICQRFEQSGESVEDLVVLRQLHDDHQGKDDHSDIPDRKEAALCGFKQKIEDLFHAAAILPMRPP